VTVVGEPATVWVVPTLAVPAMLEPVNVAVIAVVSPAWLLGCHEVEAAPEALSVVELGLNDVVYPEVG
jgi:hypothetical protein